MEDKKEQLETLDIVISIYNQEKLIAKVLRGVLINTITPFNLILIFDGCTDDSEKNAINFINKQKNKTAFMKEVTVRKTPNIYETKANNVGLRIANSKYIATIQDDMVINEYGWEKRLTYPLRRFGDVFAVTARGAQDILPGDGSTEKYSDTADRVLGLPRNIFAVRDVINRGPIAFKLDHLKRLGYLNEEYAPCCLDDADLCLRAWEQYKWRCGVLWIDYTSKPKWGKTRAKDSTMGTNKSNERNVSRLYNDHKIYINSGIKHSIDYKIEDRDIATYDEFSQKIKLTSSLRGTSGKVLEKIHIKKYVSYSIQVLRKIYSGVLIRRQNKSNDHSITSLMNSLADNRISKKGFLRKINR